MIWTAVALFCGILRTPSLSFCFFFLKNENTIVMFSLWECLYISLKSSRVALELTERCLTHQKFQLLWEIRLLSSFWHPISGRQGVKGCWNFPMFSIYPEAAGGGGALSAAILHWWEVFEEHSGLEMFVGTVLSSVSNSSWMYVMIKPAEEPAQFLWLCPG